MARVWAWLRLASSVLLLTIGGLLSTFAQASDSIDLLSQQANRLVAAGRADDARQLLLEFELSLAGNSQYDFALAEATRLTASAAEAEGLYERVVASDPLHAEAWMRLGHYAFIQADKPKLYTIVGQLEQLQPPPAAAKLIDDWYRWLGVLPTDRNGHWLSVGAGADTNINLGPADDSFVDQDIELTSGSIAKSSGFITTSAGLYGGNRAGLGQARHYRMSASQTEFGSNAEDQQQYAATVSWQWGQSKRQLTTSLGYRHFQNDINESFESTVADIRHRWWLSYWQQLSVSAGHMVRRFDKGDGQPHVRDADRWQLGLDWNYRIDPKSHVVVVTSWYQDQPKTTGSAFKLRGEGLVVSWQSTLRRGLRRTVFVAWNDIQYSNTDSAFGREREETITALGLRMNWLLSRKPGLWAEFELSRQDRNANIDVFDYDRFKWQFSIQWRT